MALSRSPASKPVSTNPSIKGVLEYVEGSARGSLSRSNPMTEDGRYSLHRLDDAFMRAHPHDWATGARLAREFTAGTVALLEYYVRNWGRSPEQREPLSDASLLPKLSVVEPFLSAEQREIITSAQARLHALQVARYGDDNGDDDNEEREDDRPHR
jgi:hypothetical protein